MTTTTSENAIVPVNSASAEAVPACPVSVRGGQKMLQLWGASSEDERESCELFLELKDMEASSAAETYFDFADKWFAKYPKQDKKSYERGINAIKNGAKLAGISPVTVYKILQTTSFYGRDGFVSLRSKAKENGVTLKWIHLRTIAGRLHNNRAARTKVEQLLITNQWSEKQLNEAIDEAAPETVSGSKSQVGNNSPSLISVVAGFRHLVKNMSRWRQVIIQTDKEYDGSAEKGKILTSQLDELLACFSMTLSFIQDETEHLTSLRKSLTMFSGGESADADIAGKAAAIMQTLQAEHQAEQQEKQAKAKRQEVWNSTLSFDDEDELEDDIYCDENEEDSRDLFEEIMGVLN